MSASISILPDWDFKSIADNAGATSHRVSNGVMYAECDQVSLNNAVSMYDHLASINGVKVNAFTGAVQAHMDATAQARGYDDIFTAISYVTSTHPTFGPEAIAFRDWRDTVWDICYSLLATWQAGGEEPTIEDVISGLPAFAV